MDLCPHCDAGPTYFFDDWQSGQIGCRRCGARWNERQNIWLQALQEAQRKTNSKRGRPRVPWRMPILTS